MSISIGASASSGASAPPVKLPRPSQSADRTQAAQQTVRTQSAIATAQQALANANGLVDQDKRNHSPGCVACDQKLVDKAQAQLTHAKASASDQAVGTLMPPGSTVDFSA